MRAAQRPQCAEARIGFVEVDALHERQADVGCAGEAFAERDAVGAFFFVFAEADHCGSISFGHEILSVARVTKVSLTVWPIWREGIALR